MYLQKNHNQIISDTIYKDLSNDLGIVPRPESKLDDIYGNVNGADCECSYCKSKDFKECYKWNKSIICGDCKQRFCSNSNLGQFTLILHAPTELKE